MPSNKIDLPPEIARRFVEDMRAYLAEPNRIKQDEIAARQLEPLNKYRTNKMKKIRIHDVREMFDMMREHLGE